MMSKRVWAGAVVAAMMLLGGCGGGFFIDTNTSSTTTSTTGNYIYAVNRTANTINEYTIASGALTLVTGSPLSAVSGLAASSVAVSRVNTYVWVGGNGAISSYTIGSTGALTLAASQAAAATANFVSLETSPDGQWLLAVDSQTFTIYVYAINTSTGSLTVHQALTYAVPGAGTAAPTMLRISPNAAFVGLALGAGGDAIFSFNTGTGVLTQLSSGAITPAGSTDNAVQFDGTSAFMYAARVGQTSGLSTVQSFGLSTSGLTAISSTGTGDSPGALLLDYTSAYLYAANAGSATVSGFKVGATTANSSVGTLTALTASPFASGPSPSRMVEDKTHAYIVVSGLAGGADLTLYKLDAITVGNLDAVGTVTSGTAGIVALAATH